MKLGGIDCYWVLGMMAQNARVYSLHKAADWWPECMLTGRG